MEKLTKNAQKDSLNIAKKSYEPSKLEIVTFTQDVMISSSFETKGLYDKTDGVWDWNLFGD